MIPSSQNKEDNGEGSSANVPGSSPSDVAAEARMSAEPPPPAESAPIPEPLPQATSEGTNSNPNPNQLPSSVATSPASAPPASLTAPMSTANSSSVISPASLDVPTPRPPPNSTAPPITKMIATKTTEEATKTTEEATKAAEPARYTTRSQPLPSTGLGELCRPIAHETLAIGDIDPVDNSIVTGRTCSQCREAKVKCDKKEPCGRCLRRGLMCVAQTRGPGRPPSKTGKKIAPPKTDGGKRKTRGAADGGGAGGGRKPNRAAKRKKRDNMLMADDPMYFGIDPASAVDPINNANFQQQMLVPPLGGQKAGTTQSNASLLQTTNNTSNFLASLFAQQNAFLQMANSPGYSQIDPASKRQLMQMVSNNSAILNQHFANMQNQLPTLDDVGGGDWLKGMWGGMMKNTAASSSSSTPPQPQSKAQSKASQSGGDESNSKPQSDTSLKYTTLMTGNPKVDIMSPNIQVMRRIIDLFSVNDINDLLELMTDDVFIDIGTASTLVPLFGSFIGKDGVKEWCDRWHNNLIIHSLEMKNLEIKGNAVFGDFHYSVTSKVNGWRSSKTFVDAQKWMYSEHGVVKGWYWYPNVEDWVRLFTPDAGLNEGLGMGNGKGNGNGNGNGNGSGGGEVGKLGGGGNDSRKPLLNYQALSPMGIDWSSAMMKLNQHTVKEDDQKSNASSGVGSNMSGLSFLDGCGLLTPLGEMSPGSSPIHPSVQGGPATPHVGNGVMTLNNSSTATDTYTNNTNHSEDTTGGEVNNTTATTSES